MAVPQGFIGTIEDDDEVQNDDIDSEEEEVSSIVDSHYGKPIKRSYGHLVSLDPQQEDSEQEILWPVQRWV